MNTPLNVHKALSNRLIYVAKALRKNHSEYNVVPVITEVGGKVGVWIIENNCEPIEIRTYLENTDHCFLTFCISHSYSGSSDLGEALINAHNAWKQKNKP